MMMLQEWLQVSEIYIIALYITGWTIGEFAGPLVGGNMVEYIAFERVCAIFGFVMLANSLLYLAYCVHLNHKAVKTSD
jgi:hypothetical protein